MAGAIKTLQFSEGTTVSAPTTPTSWTFAADVTYKSIYADRNSSTVASDAATFVANYSARFKSGAASASIWMASATGGSQWIQAGNFNLTTLNDLVLNPLGGNVSTSGDMAVGGDLTTTGAYQLGGDTFAYLSGNDTRFLNVNSAGVIDFRNDADSASNFTISDAGVVAVPRSGLVVGSASSGGQGTISSSSTISAVGSINSDLDIHVSNSNLSSNASARMVLESDAGSAFVRKNSLARTSGGGAETLNVINESAGVYLAVGGTSWTAISDMRYKTKVSDFGDGLRKLRGLSTFLYKLNDEESEGRKGSDLVHLGMSAQEVVDVLPEIVSAPHSEKMGIMYDRLTVVLVDAVKELAAKVEALEAS